MHKTLDIRSFMDTLYKNCSILNGNLHKNVVCTDFVIKYYINYPVKSCVGLKMKITSN
jgi:hypothetical protein